MRYVILAMLLAAAPAFAQSSDEEAPICADRPSKANATCITPAGALQLETDLANWTRDREGGVRTDTILYTSPTLKYGLTGSDEVQISITPWQEVRTRAAGITDSANGVGDLTLRYKRMLTASDANLQIDLLPFVKLPTARHAIGNGKVEGGVALPVSFSLPAGFSLTLGPEGDLLADSDGHGRHFSLVNVLNLGKQLGRNVALTAELWGNQDFDPAGTVEQYSADAAVAWIVTPRLQLDAGANFGLNRNTPDFQFYLGFATRL